MIDMLVIEKSSQIEQALSASKIAPEVFEDEVKALNVLEQRSSVLILLHYNVREEQTPSYIKLVLKASPQSKVVVLANELSERNILNILLAGAHGFQLINGFESCSRKLITVIGEGEVWITRKMTARLLDALRS